MGLAGATDQNQVRLRVENLSGPELPDPASFEVRSGEILGLFGLIGAGRSEMLRLLCGADSRKSGSVEVDGIKVSADSPRKSIEAGIMLCPEDRKADGILQGRSIEENIAISTRRHFSPWD